MIDAAQSTGDIQLSAKDDTGKTQSYALECNLSNVEIFLFDLNKNALCI